MGQIIILFQMVSLGITYEGVSGKLTEDNANIGKNCEFVKAIMESELQETMFSSPTKTFYWEIESFWRAFGQHPSPQSLMSMS